MEDLLAGLLGTALNVATEALQEPATETGPPERRYVSHGAPAADCEMLATYALPARVLPAAGPGCATIPVASFAVVLYRCVTAVADSPEPGPPPTSTLDAEARSLAVDGWALLRGFLAARRGGEFSADSGSVTVGPLQPLPPGGGIAGWQLNVEVQGPAATAAGS